MACKLLTTHQFERDLKRCKKRGLPMDKLKDVIKELVANGKVPASFKPHLLHTRSENVIYNLTGCLYGNRTIQS
jgi:mRNA interferase YafQ